LGENAVQENNQLHFKAVKWSIDEAPGNWDSWTAKVLKQIILK